MTASRSDQAADECTARGHRLANAHELEKAYREDGFRHCACGWVNHDMVVRVGCTGMVTITQCWKFAPINFAVYCFADSDKNTTPEPGLAQEPEEVMGGEFTGAHTSYILYTNINIKCNINNE